MKSARFSDLELVFYSVALLSVTFHSAIVFRSAVKWERIPAMQKYFPRTLSVGHALVNLVMYAYTYSNVLETSWKVSIALVVPCLGAICSNAVYFMAQYYVKFFHTEQQIQTATDVIHRRSSLKQIPRWRLRSEKILNAILVSRTNYLCILICNSILVSLPFYLVVYLSDQEFFNSKTTNVNVGNSLISILVIVAAVGSFYNAIMYWFVSKIWKVRKDYVLFSFFVVLGVILSYMTLSVVVIYSTDLLQVAVQYFEFRPLIIFLVPLESFNIFAHFVWLPRTVRLTKVAKKIEDNSKLGSDSKSKSMEPSKTVSMGYDVLMSDLLKMIECPIGNQLLLEASRREFCVENLLFLNAVRAWESIDKSKKEDQSTMFNDILELYIRSGSQCEINISHDVRFRIEEKASSVNLENIDELVQSNFFGDAIVEVRALIIEQTFVRLKTTPVYTDYVNSL